MKDFKKGRSLLGLNRNMKDVSGGIETQQLAYQLNEIKKCFLCFFEIINNLEEEDPNIVVPRYHQGPRLPLPGSLYCICGFLLMVTTGLQFQTSHLHSR